MIQKIECSDFKRDCGADPQGVVACTDLFSHQQDCEPCADFYRSMLALDAQLLTALKLPVLSSSLDQQLSSTNKVTSIIKPLTERFRPWMAAAASVLVGSFGFFALQYSAPAIAAEVIEHMHHEPELLTLTKSITNEEQIDMVLKQVNIDLSETSLDILAAKLCPIDGQLAAHLVVRGESGSPVTVLIFPDKQVKAKSIKSKEFNGRILSVEHGAIAVIGGKREDPERLQQVVLEAFHFRG